ncbi:hypothetical protein ABIE38_003498 [Dietzia sp. 2505]|uniref:DUF262 domain-containing protein n=1 Tax=Dietzia sp. 2505 TaxID=3156457 RepID=UPI003391811B
MADDTAAPMLVSQLFDGTRYRVPMYQRAYAWGADEIEALFTDIRDMRKHAAQGRYYIGTLVAHRSRPADDGYPTFDVVDGQQRLTTLFLTFANPVLRSYIGSGTVLPVVSPSMLTYEGRPRSSGDLGSLVLMEDERELESLHDDGIRAASELIAALTQRNDITSEDVRYLLDNVAIVRTLLPANTDLNHYFEIMNSRGEQLEKHEIVKAHLMECLDEAVDRRAFAGIWDMCTDLAKHVQATTPKKNRTHLFGPDWNALKPLNFDSLGEMLAMSETPRADRGILHLLNTAGPKGNPNTSEDDDETPRYGAIIDFPNFLLHVLRLHIAAELPDVDPSTVAFDDKRLVEQFRTHFLPGDAPAVKRFGEELIRARFLFDNFVIRTDRVRDTTHDDSNWVIHRPHRTGEGRSEKVSPESTFDVDVQAQVLMLQAMYQVTDSRRSYKEFLYGILTELRDQWLEFQSVDPARLIEVIESMAATRANLDAVAGLDSGTAVRHFVFNYLDYRLWRAFVLDAEPAPSDVKAGDFRFRYRTSIEHFYPVAPERDPIPSEVVNQFGNLCIMGREENSRRSNLMPEAKIIQYLSSDQSLKFQVMSSMANSENAWGEDQMRRHGVEMMSRFTSKSEAHPQAVPQPRIP